MPWRLWRSTASITEDKKDWEQGMYSFEQLMWPVWDTDTIYDEFLTMVRGNGVAEAPLLYTPDAVLSVTSADKTVQYECGRDWEIDGDIFRLTANSNIFAFAEDALIFDEAKPNESFPTADGKHSLFHEGHFFHDRQICITYKKHAESGFSVAYCGHRMPRMVEKLQNRDELKIVLFGDSIAEGANSSGRSLTTPFLPTWGSLFAENLRRHYQTKINMINTSKGGMDSYWAMENAEQRVAVYEPDVAIIAFGMNDRDEGEQFARNIEKIRAIIARKSPHTEYVLCATNAPNPRLKSFYKHQNEYQGALMGFQEQGTVIADFYSMQKFLLQRKRFIDLTGNNVNHPNDFMIRCHAQLLSEMFIKR